MIILIAFLVLLFGALAILAAGESSEYGDDKAPFLIVGLVLIAALWLSSGCVVPGDEPRGPEPLLLCHNANCAAPTDPFRDDTMETLDESLELRLDGRPILDGVEIDILWSADRNRCIYGHDLERNGDGPDAEVAGARVVRHLAEEAEPTWSGAPFHVKIELKTDVSRDGAEQTPEQQVLVSECGLDLAEQLQAGAAAVDESVVIFFDSGPDQLVNLISRPRWRNQPHDYLLNASNKAELPLGLRVDALSISAEEVYAGIYADRPDDVQFIFNMYDVTVETTHTIDAFVPEFVATNEAPFIRRWLVEQW